VRPRADDADPHERHLRECGQRGKGDPDQQIAGGKEQAVAKGMAWAVPQIGRQ